MASFRESRQHIITFSISSNISSRYSVSRVNLMGNYPYECKVYFQRELHSFFQLREQVRHYVL